MLILLFFGHMEFVIKIIIAGGVKLIDNFYDSFHEWLIFTKAIIQLAIVRLTHLALRLIKVNVAENGANIELHL
jgi:hypothetical protein